MITIYPGSFDPLTGGHLSIIRRAAALFPRLIVVVGYNPNKKTMFTLEQRLQFIREAVEPLGNVELDSFTGELLVDYARRVGATVVVRGLRNHADFYNEFQQSTMNKQLMPGLETVFLPSDADDLFVSSTLVREAIRAGREYRQFVPGAQDTGSASEGT